MKELVFSSATKRGYGKKKARIYVFSRKTIRKIKGKSMIVQVLSMYRGFLLHRTEFENL